MRQPLVDPTGRAIGNPGGFPPDRRYGIRRVMGCRGLPSNIYGNNGDLATDPTTSKVYVKRNNAWAFKGQGFQRLFPSGGGSHNTVCVNGDPILYNGDVYTLTSTATGRAVHLSWTFPAAMAPHDTPYQNGGYSLTLQKSTTAKNLILSQGEQDAGVGKSVTYGVPPPDANWANILSLGIVDNAYRDYQKSFDDTIASDVHLVNYRLIMITTGSDLTPPPFARIELDWNLVTVMIPYVVTAVAQVDGVHVSWV